MPAAKGQITAHVTKVSQDKANITTLVMSEAQILELMALLTVGLREKAVHHPDGCYHLAKWKENTVNKCQANPPCQGGDATLNLVRPSKSK